MRLQLGDVGGRAAEPGPEEGWHRIHSPSMRLGYALAGVIGLLIPFGICFWLSVAPAFVARMTVGKSGAVALGPGLAALPALVLFIPLHELLHAIWHPQMGLSPRTVIAIWPAKLRFGVYYEGCMTRRRWLAMRLAPLFFLTVVPVVVLTLFRFVAAWSALDIFLQVLFLVNGIGSGGDIVAASWVLRQVPAGAQICFRGGKAYWWAMQA